MWDELWVCAMDEIIYKANVMKKYELVDYVDW